MRNSTEVECVVDGLVILHASIAIHRALDSSIFNCSCFCTVLVDYSSWLSNTYKLVQRVCYTIVKILSYPLDEKVLRYCTALHRIWIWIIVLLCLTSRSPSERNIAKYSLQTHSPDWPLV